MPKACVLRIEGTNCEEEMKRALENSGIDTELVHLKQLTGDAPPERKRNLFDYQILMLPGGWSAGDYIRAGAIFAARIKSKLRSEIKEFVDNGYLVGGVCNGFQILAELGLLPGFRGISEYPEAVLTNNINSKFQCRPAYIKHTNRCAFTELLEKDKILQIPIAHAEGRFTFGKNDKKFLNELIENNQIIFRYCRENGGYANGEFPFNPNGSLFDIAGICNPEGNVLGMMPHPERAVYRIQMDGWTRKQTLFFRKEKVLHPKNSFGIFGPEKTAMQFLGKKNSHSEFLCPISANPKNSFGIFGPIEHSAQSGGRNSGPMRMEFSFGHKNFALQNFSCPQKKLLYKRNNIEEFGDGKIIFDSIADYVNRVGI